jgi:hypothetical protein
MMPGSPTVSVANPGRAMRLLGAARFEEHVKNHVQCVEVRDRRPRVVLIGPEQGDMEIQAFTNLWLDILDYASTWLDGRLMKRAEISDSRVSKRKRSSFPPLERIILRGQDVLLGATPSGTACGDRQLH